MSVSPPSPPPASRRADLALAGLWLVVVAHQAVFQVLDARIPGDQGRYFTQIPRYYWDLETWETAKGALLRALVDSTGWYDLAVAGLLRAFGRSPLPMEGLGVAFYGLLLGFTALTARRLAGPVAGACALALTAALPMVTLFGRKEWIHVPEAALAMAMAWVWLGDPALSRRRTVAGLVVPGALMILLRPSGLVWAGLLGLALAVSAWWGTVPRRRLIATGIGLGLAALPLLPGLALYLERKAIARGRYAAEMPEIAMQVRSLFGHLPLLICALGIVLALIRVGPPRRAPTVLLAVWALVPVPMVGLFRSGIDNFTAFAPALAVGVGVGLAATHRALAALPLAALAAYLGFQWVPPRAVPELPLIVPDDARYTTLNVRYRPDATYGGATVGALLDAVCDTDEWRACHVVVDQGLFTPTSEEFGLLELFLLGQDRVGLRTVYEAPDEGWRAWGVDALVSFRCRNTDWIWWRRSPDLPQKTVDLAVQTDMVQVWWDQVQPDCSVVWFTPNGQLARPEALPTASDPDSVEAWSPELVRASYESFLASSPQLAGAQGHLTVVDDGQWDFAGPPAGWSPARGAWHRERAARALGR